MEMVPCHPIREFVIPTAVFDLWFSISVSKKAEPVSDSILRPVHFLPASELRIEKIPLPFVESPVLFSEAIKIWICLSREFGICTDSQLRVCTSLRSSERQFRSIRCSPGYFGPQIHICDFHRFAFTFSRSSEFFSEADHDRSDSEEDLGPPRACADSDSLGVPEVPREGGYRSRICARTEGLFSCCESTSVVRPPVGCQFLFIHPE
jgi:hypothetical protein